MIIQLFFFISLVVFHDVSCLYIVRRSRPQYQYRYPFSQNYFLNRDSGLGWYGDTYYGNRGLYQNLHGTSRSYPTYQNYYNFISPYTLSSQRRSQSYGNGFYNNDVIDNMLESRRKARVSSGFPSSIAKYLPLPVGEKFKPSPFRDPRANKRPLPSGPALPEVEYAADIIKAKVRAGYYGNKPLFNL